ncbi:MAG: VTT domain-containing protein [Acidobacteria bacterium]|nr:VTT domain-containing protein [Acidobacteriota bacterium]
MSEQQSDSPWKRNARIAVVFLAIVAAIVVMKSPVRELMEPAELRAVLTDLRASAQASWYAPLLFIGAYVVGGTVFVPATLFILTAAFLWGWLVGGFYALVGAVLCAVLSFEMSRYVFGRLAERLFRERLPWLHRQFDGAGIRSVLLMRLVPGIPFPVFNIGAGLTALRSRDYFVGSLIGLTIPTFIIAFSADALFSGTLDRGVMAGRLAVAAALLALLILVPPMIAKRMRNRSVLPRPVPADREQQRSVVN